MRRPRLLILLATLLLAGCATDAPSADAPAAADDAQPPPPPTSEPFEPLVFETNLTFENKTGVHEERFRLEGAHWICVDTEVEGSGAANLTLTVPEHPRPWQLAATDGNATSAEMIPGMPGEYVVRIDLAEYTGRVWIRVEKQPAEEPEPAGEGGPA